MSLAASSVANKVVKNATAKFFVYVLFLCYELKYVISIGLNLNKRFILADILCVTLSNAYFPGSYVIQCVLINVN